MAAKGKGKATATKAETKAPAKSKVKVSVKVVTVADLADEYGMRPQKLRALIREAGFKAPATDIQGFGPKAKYEWPADSKDLAKIRKALDAAVAADEAEEEEEE